MKKTFLKVIPRIFFFFCWGRGDLTLDVSIRITRRCQISYKALGQKHLLANMNSCRSESKPNNKKAIINSSQGLIYCSKSVVKDQKNFKITMILRQQFIRLLIGKFFVMSHKLKKHYYDAKMKRKIYLRLKSSQKSHKFTVAEIWGSMLYHNHAEITESSLIQYLQAKSSSQAGY